MPRYDAVLIKNYRHSVNEGYRAFDVARVRLFFSFPFLGRELQLALVDVYEKVSVSFYLPVIASC